ncbi:MAG: lytic transglycosylase domain-containing protein [Proteobacteria bacterium]|jgi:soluble lytic murein transglycosylase|nr:lytic transglycosylase domain-containing protein [Alphaproteobacteria bacterium]NCC02459.1 lytic transglycosylase domain-containing protein [Pseudomonadota bacterium]
MLRLIFAIFALFLAGLTPAQASHGYLDAFVALDKRETGPAKSLVYRGGNAVLNKVLKAELMAQPGNDYSFDELATFITENPNWPGLNGIRMIAEQKLPSGANSQRVIRWFTSYPPLTLAGFFRYADALENSSGRKKVVELARERWINKDMSKAEQTEFLGRYRHLLTKKDHEKRLSRLLWDNQIAGARAMYSYVSKDWQALAEARIALANQTNTANGLLSKVPASLRKDPGLLYDRLKWRRKNDLDKEALDILLNPPNDPDHADKWWDERNIMIRRAMEGKDFNLAYRLASNHGTMKGFDYIQAEFLAGWLALRFKNRPDIAHKHFSHFIEEAGTPISRARGYYWLGRTYEAANQPHDARQAYETAGTINTTFYGQLALARLDSSPVIQAMPEPAIPENIRTAFYRSSLITAVEQLYNAGVYGRAEKFFKAASDVATKRVDFALLLELAYQLQRPDWAVKAAKAANQHNIIVPGGSFPVLDIKIPQPPELALTHALIRQESQFQADVGSPAGAKGLMQLMPGTAKDVCKELGIAYRPQSLSDPDYNVRLGTTFIQKQIDSFDGSYVLALAGYNAGPRRARQWIDLFGDPRTANVDAIDWIELIPIYETRNYVQRIIENLQFYRAKLNGGQAPLLIMQDLKR